MVRRSLNRRNGGKRRRSMRGGEDEKKTGAARQKVKRQGARAGFNLEDPDGYIKAQEKKKNFNIVNEVINGEKDVYICCFLDDHIIDALKERLKLTEEELKDKGHIFININTYNITENGRDIGWMQKNVDFIGKEKLNSHAVFLNKLKMKRDNEKEWTVKSDDIKLGVEAASINSLDYKKRDELLGKLVKKLKGSGSDVIKVAENFREEEQDVNTKLDELKSKKIILLNPAATVMFDEANTILEREGFNKDIFDGEHPVKVTFIVGKNVRDFFSTEKAVEDEAAAAEAVEDEVATAEEAAVQQLQSWKDTQRINDPKMIQWIESLDDEEQKKIMNAYARKEGEKTSQITSELLTAIQIDFESL